MSQFKLKIDGMHCASCVHRVSQALTSTEGLVVNEVTVGTAQLASATEPPPVDQAIAALAKVGYAAHLES